MEKSEYDFAYEFRRYAESLRKPVRTFRRSSTQELVVEELERDVAARADDPQRDEKKLLWKLLNLLGIKDPKTGNLLTVHDAIKSKIFDIDQATLVVDDGQNALSLEEALRRNAIDTQLYDSLKQLHELSKKYEINLIDRDDMVEDVDGSEKRIKVIAFNPNEAKSVAEAIKDGDVDSTSGLFRLQNGQLITLHEAYKFGYLIQNEKVRIKPTPISFSDALARGLFDNNGFIIDRNSGAKFQLHSAIENNMIFDNLREVVDTKNDEKITVKKALAIGLLDSHKGLLINSLSNEQCTFNFAYSSRLISKPLTLKDLFDMELIKDNCMILSPTFSKWLTIKQAIDSGVLDFANFKCVSKTKGNLVTLSEAIECGVISLDGNYKDIVTDEVFPIKSAVDRGLISSVSQKSIFDIDGFKDPQDGTFVSFNVALQKRILRRDESCFVLLTSGDNRFQTLDEGIEAGNVRPEVYSMLMRHIGVFDSDKNELRVIDLAFYRLIDPISGYLLVAESGEKVPLDTAIERQFVTASGALLLSSLLNITLTTETITKTVKRYVTIRDVGSSSQTITHPSFSEAVQKGLISIDEQTYRQPEEEQYYMVQDALNSDRVLADTEKLGGPRIAKLTIVTKSFSPTNGQSSSSQTVVEMEPKSNIKILKRMQKKVINLSDALHMGLINEETYELLENNVTFAHNPDTFLKSKKYKLRDPQSGIQLTLEEAIEREILNPNNITKFYIPFSKSLTIPQLFDRDLIDRESQKIIHPETGDLLTLNEALACDIVDKYSLIRNDKKHKITLKEALKCDYIDGSSSTVKTKKGALNLQAAADRGLFEIEKSKDKSKKTSTSDIPLIGQTFPVIVKRKLFDPLSREVIHNISGQRISIKAAIERDYIMSVPCTPNADEIFIIDALDQGLINFETETFISPKSGERMTLFDAYNKGFLIVKPLHSIIAHESLKTTQVTKEVKNVSHTVKTKSIDILEGFTMISANEITNNKTGEIISLDEAKDQGIAIERVEVNQFTTSQFDTGNVSESDKFQHEKSIEKETQITREPSLPKDIVEDVQSGKESTSTTHVTIKKVTVIKEIMLDENGQPISEKIIGEPTTIETIPTEEMEFKEIISRFNEENPDFANSEEFVTETTENGDIIKRIVKEYNIVTNQTEVIKKSWTESETEESISAAEEQPSPTKTTIRRIVKEFFPEKSSEPIEREDLEYVPVGQMTTDESSHISTTVTTTTTRKVTTENVSELEKTTSSDEDFEIIEKPTVSEETTVEELPDGKRKKIIITTTRIISKKPEDIKEKTVDEQQKIEPPIDETSVFGKTKTIITSTIKSFSEKFNKESDQQRIVQKEHEPTIKDPIVERETNGPEVTKDAEKFAPPIKADATIITKMSEMEKMPTDEQKVIEKTVQAPVPAPRIKKLKPDANLLTDFLNNERKPFDKVPKTIILTSETITRTSPERSFISDEPIKPDVTEKLIEPEDFARPCEGRPKTITKFEEKQETMVTTSENFARLSPEKLPSEESIKQEKHEKPIKTFEEKPETVVITSEIITRLSPERLSSDESIKPGKVERPIETFEEKPETVIITSETITRSSQEKCLKSDVTLTKSDITAKFIELEKGIEVSEEAPQTTTYTGVPMTVPSSERLPSDESIKPGKVGRPIETFEEKPETEVITSETITKIWPERLLSDESIKPGKVERPIETFEEKPETVIITSETITRSSQEKFLKSDVTLTKSDITAKFIELEKGVEVYEEAPQITTYTGVPMAVPSSERLPSDESIKPEKVEKHIEAFEEIPETVVITSKTITISSQERVLKSDVTLTKSDITAKFIELEKGVEPSEGVPKSTTYTGPPMTVPSSGGLPSDELIKPEKDEKPIETLEQTSETVVITSETITRLSPERLPSDESIKLEKIEKPIETFEEKPETGVITSETIARISPERLPSDESIRPKNVEKHIEAFEETPETVVTTSETITSSSQERVLKSDVTLTKSDITAKFIELEKGVEPSEGVPKSTTYIGAPMTVPSSGGLPSDESIKPEKVERPIEAIQEKPETVVITSQTITRSSAERLPSDDSIKPEKVEKPIETLEQKSETVVVTRETITRLSPERLPLDETIKQEKVEKSIETSEEKPETVVITSETITRLSPERLPSDELTKPEKVENPIETFEEKSETVVITSETITRSSQEAFLKSDVTLTKSDIIAKFIELERSFEPFTGAPISIPDTGEPIMISSREMPPSEASTKPDEAEKLFKIIEEKPEIVSITREIVTRPSSEKELKSEENDIETSESAETHISSTQHFTKTTIITTSKTSSEFTETFEPEVSESFEISEESPKEIHLPKSQEEIDDEHLKHLETIVISTLAETGDRNHQPKTIVHKVIFDETIEEKIDEPKYIIEDETDKVDEIIEEAFKVLEREEEPMPETLESEKPEPEIMKPIDSRDLQEVTPEPEQQQSTQIESLRSSTSRESSPFSSSKSQTGEMTKVKQFTVAENVIEVIPIRDAIKQGKVEPRICRIMVNGNEMPMTVHDALTAKELSPTDVVQIISSHIVVLMKDQPKAYLLNFKDNFTENKLLEVGLYDPRVPRFVDPWTGNQISFEFFIFNLDVLDHSIFVKDQSSESYIPIRQAFDKKIIDPQLGSVIDLKSNQHIPIFEAVDRKLVIQRSPQDMRVIKRPSSLTDLMKHGNINLDADEVIINNENLSFAEALRRGAIDSNSVSVRDPATGDILGFKFASDRGIVDIRRGVIINLITLEETLIIIAYRRGYLLIGKIQPISINAAITSGLYDANSNKIKNPSNQQLLSLQDAIDSGVIDPSLTEIKNFKNNSLVPLKEAIQFKLVDPQVNMVKNKKSAVPLDKALKDKLLVDKIQPLDLAEIISKNYYDPQTGKILNPYTNRCITIREAIKLNIINITFIRIYDVMQDKVYSVDDAILNGLLDDEKGIITRPTMPLDKAYLQRIIISFNGPLSLPSALNCNIFDPETRKYKFDDKHLNLGEAIESNKIAGNELVLYQPDRKTLSTLNEAIKAGFLDPIESVIADPITNKEIPIDDAMEQGLLVKSRSDVNLQDAVFDGLYDPECGTFSNVITPEKLSLDSAINRNLIDVKSTVINVNNVTLDFEQAIEQGIIDPQSSTIETKSGVKVNLLEAFDQGILSTISKPVRLHEAIIKNLYDESCGLFIDPETSKKLTIQESIQEGLIDPNSIQIQDPGSKSYLPISINFAIQTGLINGKDGNVNHDNKTYPLKDAFDQGIVIDHKGPVSIQRAIHQGSFDEKTGRISDPFSNKMITVHEAMRKFVVNPHLPCYFDDENEKLMSLNEACKLKLIDRFQGDFTVPYSGEKLTLDEAMKQGWIIDIEGGNFSLYKILLLRLFDIQSGKIIHPVTGRSLSLNQAIDVELIDPIASLVKNRNGKYFTLSDALKSGIVDGDKNLYWISETQSFPLSVAKEKGLIVSNEKPFGMQYAINMRLYRSETGKFADPLTNTFCDLKSAIDAGIIDEDSAQFRNILTKQVKPLYQAITDGDINVAKGRVFDQKSGSSFNYDVAFEKGLLIHLPRGFVQKAEKVPIHEPIPMIKIDLVEANKPREMTLDEVIHAGIINPDTAMIKDPQTGKFILLRIFIEKYQINLAQKATVDPKSPFFVFGPQCVIYHTEPLSFDDVIESEQLNLVTGKLVDPRDNAKECTIQEAIDIGVLDPTTILIKDSAKNKLMRIDEALRKGLIDPERSHVVDTVTSKLYNLENAIQEGLLKTPKKQFDLLEALEFSLYDPTTGYFTDPFAPSTEDLKQKCLITFEEGISRGLIDSTTTMVRSSPESEIIPISAAIAAGLIDPVTGKLTIINPDNNQTELIDFITAKERDLLVPAGQRQAVIERFALCEENISILLKWINDIEQRISKIGGPQEHIEELAAQINVLKQIKNDIDLQARPVASCLEQVRQLVLTSGNVLSIAEITTLENSGRQLRFRADRAHESTIKLVKHLNNSYDELDKLQGEIHDFAKWLQNAHQTLETEQEQLSDLQQLPTQAIRIKDAQKEIIAHQADLRFITISTQKFVDEGNEYLTVLNELRISLPERLPNIEPIASFKSPVRQTVSDLQQRYSELLGASNSLADRQNTIRDAYRLYNESLGKGRNWLSDIQIRVSSIVSNPVGTDIETIQEQANMAKSLYNEFLNNGKLVDNLQQNLNTLLVALTEIASPPEISALEIPVDQIKKDYKQLLEAVDNRCKMLEVAFVQAQGVQDALDNLISHMKQTEDKIHLQMQPASLIAEKLTEQIREHQFVLSDLEMHRASLNSLTSSAADLLRTPSNARLAKVIESKLQSVTDQYSRLRDKAMTHNEFLDSILRKLIKFNNDSTIVENDLKQLQEMINVDEKSVDILMKYLQDIVQNRKKIQPAYEDCIYLGKDLVERKDVTDAYVVKDKMKRLQAMWDGLEMRLDEKLKLTKQKSEKLAAFEISRTEIFLWLSQMETRTSVFDPVALDLSVIRKQSDEHKLLQTEYKDFSKVIQRTNDIGAEYDSLIRASSPIKDAVDRQDLNDLTSMQQELMEINHRYNFIGVKLADRQKELDETRDTVQRQKENLEFLNIFLNKSEKDLPKYNLTIRDNAEKCIKHVRKQQDDMFEKQSILDTTKTQIKDLVQSKPTVPGSETLRYELDDLIDRWTRLIDLLKECSIYSEKSLDFIETYDLIFNWLVAKEKLFSVLGPISSDPRTINSQMQQVSVLRDEFKAQQTQLDYLRDLGNALIYHFKDSSQEGKSISTKLNDIEKKWNDLADQLEKRYKNLNEVADHSKEFDASLNRLRENLQQISDSLDTLPSDSDFEGKLHKITQLERQLEGQRPLLADAEATAVSLTSVISDPKSAADIKAKVQALGKQYLALQKKLDNIKAENEAGLKDKRQFLENCAKTVGWIANKLSSFSGPLFVSAHKPTLLYQIETHDPIYREVISKEYEIIMLMNRGKDLQDKLGESITDIEKITNQWTRLKDEAQERQTRLQKASELNKNYDRTSGSFLSWLNNAERDLDSLKAGVLVKKELDREVREIQLLRNEMLKKSSDYDKTQNQCASFLGACDVDKDTLTSEMQLTKERWDDLNRAINLKLERISGFTDKLMDFTDQFRQLSTLVQRNEDAFDTVERIHGASAGRDPRSLEKIKTIKEDNGELKKNFQNLRIMVENIVTETRPAGYNSDNLYADLENLSDRILTLQSRLDDRFNELQIASNAIAKFNEGVNYITLDLSSLENEVDTLSAPGREVKQVRNQLETGNELLRKIDDVNRKIIEAEANGDAMIEQGYVNRPSEIHEPLDQVKRRRSRLDSRTKDYIEAVQKALNMLTKFYEDYDVALNDISQIDVDLKKIKAVGSEAQQIRLQQQDFQKFRKQNIDSMDRKIDDINDLGKDLIRSAQDSVSTAALEGDLEKLVEKWNDIKARVADRDRKLDQALLQTGKFQDALKGLLTWLNDSEEMVKNQKPPSIDYKVAKAQLQEQKFLMKMIGDNQHSISSLVQLGEEVAQGCEPTEKIDIELQLKDLSNRFDQLKNNSNDRTKLLENAVDVAKLLQDQLTPLSAFLDRSEKTLKNLENIPSDEDKIQQVIFEHDRLHKEILSKDGDVANLAALKNEIRKYFDADEAEIANDKIDGIDDRYKMLRDDSERLGDLLSKTKQEMRQFLLTYQDLFAWCDKQERVLVQFKNISVHVDVINEQIEKLKTINNEAKNKEDAIRTTTAIGNELIRSISQDEAFKLKDKLDTLGRRYVDICNKAAEYLRNAEDSLALAQDFHGAHNRLVNWMQNAESILIGNAASEMEILTLEHDLTKMRSELESINSLGPQLAQLSSEEGGATLEGIITRDNRRFDAIVEQIQRKTERMQIIQQRSNEINLDLDELLQWFRDTQNHIKEAETPSIEPQIVKNQLLTHRTLNDSISSQKGRVREVTSSAKKLIRELQSSNDNLNSIREKLEDLKDIVDLVSNSSAERLSVLEQVTPLSEHFAEANEELEKWLSDIEREISLLTAPAVRADQIIQQQEKNERLMQTVSNHKPLIDKFNKTGDALAVLVNQHDAEHLHDIVETVNGRYSALKSELRDRQLALEQALQETSQFADKLENMLRTLANASEQVKNTEPISSHPPKISNQIDENWSVAEDLEKREDTYVAIKQAADDIISKATNHADPAVREIKMKLEKLNVLWVDVQKEVKIRDSTLNDTLTAAEKFWNELDQVMGKLRDLKETLSSQEPVATEPKAIQRQQSELQEVGQDITKTKPEVDQVRISGTSLITLVGDTDKPEIKKHIEDLDLAWCNITSLYAQREENLIQAMEKAMQFHETLQALLRFLDEAEDHVRGLKPIGSEISVVKRQIEEHNDFKDRVDPHGVEVEALNRQLNELSEITSVDQTAAIRSGVSSINKRWDVLKQILNDRQKQLENALLQLGQFEHALNELLVWIKKTSTTFEQIKIIPGDAKLLEIEMAKLKILVNDTQAHQNSIDTINDAGRKLLENDGSLDASATREKLENLNSLWRDLQSNISEKERELDDELVEAQNFATEMQDTLAWLNDVDGIVGSTKPVGGLPETATEQLEKFMEVYTEIEENRSKADNLLAQGANYLKKHGDLNVTSSNLQHGLRTLKQRWESVVSRAADKKIKLEIALKEATEFHESLQAFVEWLTDAEKRLGNADAISRVLPTVQKQVEDHKHFQKEFGNYREAMLQLDKKGSHLKYFSQKQDVILIKNLLISVQHRWERVVNKGTERMRALDHGYKESKEFYESWNVLISWLRDNETKMNRIDEELAGNNDPIKVKQALEQTQNIHRGLSVKQSEYDSVLRTGKSLIDKAPKYDEPELNQMLTELKELWTRNCSQSIERQRKLEEALLLSGQLSEALVTVLEWLQKAKTILTDETPVHGDIDTVSGLVDNHKRFEADLEKRSRQIDNVIENGQKLDPSNTAPGIISNLREVEELWSFVKNLNAQKNEELKKALVEAEKLHKAVNIMMEWLSDAEQKLKYAPAIPSDENEAQKLLSEFSTFLYELRDKEFEKNETLALAQNILNQAHPDAIKILRTIIQTITQRWEEISQWALNRENKLSSHLQSLKDLDGTIDDLLAWLNGLEKTLKNLEAEDLPNDAAVVEQLIEDHREFMENTANRQPEIDMICKPSRAKPTLRDAKKSSKATMRTTSRLSPSAISEATAAIDSGLPHYGPKFSSSAPAEADFRSPRAKILWDKWRNVWMLAWDRQKRLHEHLMILREQERIKSFDWDDWRKRFLKFHNHKRSRVVEFLKKIDRKQNGLVPKEDFINEIIKSKAPTKRHEIQAVADMFDVSNEGVIDWEEFLVALRPEWQQEPKCEADKIHDEVRRLVMLCTCRQKFRVFQVGEGKYRFGAEQKLRLVRILRSTVMVRVGGGWIALDEFLTKNDPCRVRGKTNAELREEFVLAAGVSQTMQAFTPRPSISSGSPMKTPHDRSTKSRTASTADSDNSDSHSHGRRTPSKSSTLTTKTSIPIRSSLTPSTSRPASKPASRHGSTLSLASDDGTPTRIPTRKIVGTTFGPPRTPTSTSKPPLSSSASKSRLLSKTPTRTDDGRPPFK